jgi:L-alanine-DL-glutamate epimerase-like enolase superfamily enzyme
VEKRNKNCQFMRLQVSAYRNLTLSSDAKARPDLAKEMGFIGAKVPLPYGPGDGDYGMKGNIDFIKSARNSVGPDFPLMIDCYV